MRLLICALVLLAGCRINVDAEENGKAKEGKKAMHFTEENFQENVLEAEQPVLVDFWAPWCGPCNMLTPVIESVAEEMGGKAVVGKVNVTEEPEIAEQYKISAIPALLFFRDGKVVHKLEGFQKEEVILEVFESLLNPPEPPAKE